MRVLRDPVVQRADTSAQAPASTTTQKLAATPTAGVPPISSGVRTDTDGIGAQHIAPQVGALGDGPAVRGSPLATRLPAGKPPGVTSQALRAFIAAQEDAQWFTGTGRGVARVEVAERAPIDLGVHAPASSAPGSAGKAGSARHELLLLNVGYKDGGHELYHVPVRVDADGTLHDALEDPAFVRAMTDAVRDGKDLRSSSGAVHAKPVAGTSLPSDTSQLAVKAMGVPQSNVSIKVGDAVMFKAYRKPEPGVSIEREVTEHLTRQQYANTPQLLGTLTVDTKSGPMTIGMVFELVQSQGDGWKNVVADLAHVADPANPAAGRALLDGVKLLGQRIGEMHKALGAPVEDPAFKPQDVTKADLGAWAATIARELDDTIAAARKHNPAVAAQLEAAKPGLLQRLDALRAVDDAAGGGAGKKMRIHGDLHLGQVLSRDKDWLVLDFEGEPARTKEERRGFYTPLRDVAGMIRSYAYAEAEARRAGHDVPQGWAKTAAREFLEGYKDATQGLGLTPADDAAFTALLSAVELEKALYEVRYELVSRPALVDVPTSRVVEMATS